MPKLKFTKSNATENNNSKFPSMELIFEAAKNGLPILKAGEIVGGTIIEKKSNAIYLDLGQLGTGIIYGAEYLSAREFLRGKIIGDKIFAKIVDIENDEGFVELSVKEAGKELSWQTISRKKETGEPIEVKISGANRGGLTAEVESIPAFLPVSQLSAAHYPKVENGDVNKILEELRKFVGQNLSVQILDIDQKEGKLILSERLKETGKIKEALKKYKVGDAVEGQITGIVDFGAFMVFGEEKLEGLIHISEMDWKLVKHPSEIVKTGDKIQVKIIEISPDGRISLSLKALKLDPWQEAEQKYKKGEVVSGKVMRFNPFGAFVELPDGMQGLCHISEFGSRKAMEEKLGIGKQYDFKVILVDASNHKISLGMATEETNK